MPDELPSQTPTPVTPTPLPPGSTGLAPNVAAGLAAFPLLGGIIFMLLEKRDQFVRFYAMQSIFLGVAWIIVGFALGVVGFIIGGIPLIGWLWFFFSRLVYLLLFAIWVVTMIQAFSGKEWEIPVLGKLARQQLARSPVL